jgi:hypothetical protein
VREDEDSLFYAGFGPLAAILLGAALVPLRGLTPASNLAFAFIVLTIVVAEFGGRGAALGTALVSALSLDFFLTQPYLRLSIEDKHDVVAFIGLAVCGLTASALASQRRRRLAELTAASGYFTALRSALGRPTPGAVPGRWLAEALRCACRIFPLEAAVLRDEADRVVAQSEPGEARPLPEIRLDASTLQPAGSEGHAWQPTLPPGGGRIPLEAGGRRLGWLDVWGNGGAFGAEARLALADFSRLVALVLAVPGPGPAPRG